MSAHLQLTAVAALKAELAQMMTLHAICMCVLSLLSHMSGA